MRRCVFFDRDGIVNVSPGPGYVERWEDFHLQDSFVQAALIAQAAGFDCVIVTNQRGIALGRMTADTVRDMHDRLSSQLEAQGVRLLDIQVCPHERGVCTCRKPQPGMLVRAAEIHTIDLNASWMVGDQETDIEAGRMAGCRTIRVGGMAEHSMADYKVADMEALHGFLKQVLKQSDSRA